ncbi:MAG: hypothetical protein ACMUJM_23155 [bacterium]
MNSLKSITEELDYLMKYHGENEESILSMALKKGMDQLYKEAVMKLYVDKKLDRIEAINILGIEIIEDLDYQKRSLKEDIELGLLDG